MKPINTYLLTRITDPERLSRLERQLSGRSTFLKIKEWEIKGLRALTDKLCEHSSDATTYDFFYSFIMPKLGKEFDLIRISSDSVVNIELKSGDVTDEAIRNQLLNNRYYLSTLGRT
ncbi:MAG: ATP-binding protein, partial [Lachnospiraceae bacterium]|nr:ATP-binding protein [Lachnospiraceae bacterium]